MRELTCVGTSHQNGVAERSIGIIFAIARTIMIDAALPPTFWGEAVITAAYVRNRLPTSANPENRSPFEIRFGRRPDLRHLRPFGITAFVRIQSHITKVQPRATKGIMIGYGESVSGQKGWRIYLPSPPRVITTTAVTFTADLQRSISTRHPSLLSNQPPMFTPTTAAALPPPPTDNGLPLSLQPPRTTVPASQAAPSSPIAAPPALQHTRAPHATITKPSPATPNAAKPTKSAAASKGPLITTPFTPVPGQPTATQTATVRRPRGRAPRGTRWDKHLGRFVSALTASTAPPNYHTVWCTVADSCPSPVCPVTYQQATTGPDQDKWHQAIESEFASLKERETWRPIRRSEMPPGAVPIKTKWVFKIKRDEHNRVTRYKARLTACGYAQRRGRDYEETFSPVASASSVRFIFAVTAALNLYLDQHDIRTAFLYGVLPKNQRVYLRVHEGLDLPNDFVLCCLRGIYGLKQSCRLFNQHLNRALSSIGYTQSKSDPCVYFKRVGDHISIVAIVVDDMIHAASTKELLQDFSARLSQLYEMTHIGSPKFMIGIKITKTKSEYFLSQQQYIEQAAAAFGQTESAPVHSPANPSGCLPGLAVTDSPPLDTTQKSYMSLIGSLLWITITRPDAQTAISLACTHSVNPTVAHWRAALRILRYLYHTRTLGLRYKIAPRPIDTSAFVDAGYGAETGHRSRRGHVVFLSGSPISWTTRATSMVCQSTSEAEFVAANECVKDVMWLRGLLHEIGFDVPATPIHEDNQATIAMIKNHIVYGRNRHFCIRMAWLREQAAANVVVFKYVNSKDNIADIFTKILPQPQFVHLRDKFLFDTSPKTSS